ncbi:phage adaptor protein, partial [Corynebacterium diphtheriae]|uniref:phage adaptor protein n=1 Tax=Corynebacterium diphtheriae TaxID=1717 RepID=UPI000D4312CA
MGTLADLKARIASELNRSDLTSEIADQVARAVDRWASKRCWFNESSGTTATTSNVATATAPTGLRVIDKLM